jgi:hypothetical protein
VHLGGVVVERVPQKRYVGFGLVYFD